LPLELVNPPLLTVAGLGGSAAVARHAPRLASLLVEGERQPRERVRRHVEQVALDVHAVNHGSCQS